MTSESAHVQPLLDGVGPICQRNANAGARAEVQGSEDRYWSYAYDVGGRLTDEVDDNNPARASFATLYAYDAVSNLAIITVGPFSPVTYSYNARDEATALEGPGGSTSFTYDPVGRLTGIETPEGSTRLFTYDAAGRVVSLETTTTSGAYTRSLTYDAAGNLLAENNTTYSYDALNRLTAWFSPSTETTTYTYDAAGNLLEVKEDTATVEAYTYDEANQITNAGFTYDADGNLTADGTRSFFYDGKGRLIEVAEGETTLVLMTYDYLDRRTSLTTAGGTTYFHYVGADVVAETDEEGDVTARYTYGPAGLQSMTRGGETYCYQSNAHGDVVSLTDDTGAVVNTYTYDPWGKLLSSTEQVENPYRYAGYRYDQATGLYYLWHRYYDPGVRRFLTEDFLAGILLAPSTLNSYVYALGNPTRFIDVTGLAAQPTPYNCHENVFGEYNIPPKDPGWEHVESGAYGAILYGFTGGHADNYYDGEFVSRVGYSGCVFALPVTPVAGGSVIGVPGSVQPDRVYYSLAVGWWIGPAFSGEWKWPPSLPSVGFGWQPAWPPRPGAVLALVSTFPLGDNYWCHMRWDPHQHDLVPVGPPRTEDCQ